jgi:hypothetical protein
LTGSGLLDLIQGTSGMIRIIVGLAAMLAAGSTSLADEPARFEGEWKTTLGPVTLEQKGEEVSGRIVFYKLPLKGKVDGKGLALEYDEGAVHVNANWEFEASGNAFKGTFKASNGNQGVWNGWRPDPTAASGKAGEISGLWLTDLGLMELTRDGPKVKGRYALRGRRAWTATSRGGTSTSGSRRSGRAPAGSTSTRRGPPSPARAGPTACPAGTAGRAARPPNSSSTCPWPPARSSTARPTAC